MNKRSEKYEIIVESNEPHQVELIDSNRRALQKRFEWIDRAQKSIRVETYFFYPDDGGLALLKALLEKKRKDPQVQITLLFDSWASSHLSAVDVEHLRKNGIEVRWYVGPASMKIGPQRHNHRKSWIFDDTVALIGGFNHSSEHLGLSGEYNVMDREIQIQGEIVSSISSAFLAIWENAQQANPQIVSHDSHIQQLESVDLESLREEAVRNKRRYPEIKVSHLSYFTHLRKKMEWAPPLQSKVHDFFASAKERVLIESRFFIPSFALTWELSRKSNSGIPVEVVTNSAVAIPNYERHFQIVATIFLKTLNFLGVNISYLSGQLKDPEQALTESSKMSVWGTHSKTYVVDNQVLIGSYNLDPASDYLNLEHFLILQSKELAEQAVRSIQNNSAN